MPGKCWCISVIVFFILDFASFGSATFNLFINQAEVRKLLGLKNELFYVREGVINKYAMNFVVPIPAHIHSLHFSWQALSKRELPYVLGIEISNPIAVPGSQVNISGSGSIPTYVQTFKILLPCSGAVSAEVDVIISINVTINHHQISNVTSLMFRRKKICLEGVSDHRLAAPVNNAVAINLPEEKLIQNAFFVAITSASGLLLIIIILSTVLIARSRKIQRNRHGERLKNSRNDSATSQASQPFLAVEVQNHYTTVCSSKSGTPSYASLKPVHSCTLSQFTLDEKSKDLEDIISELMLNRCKIRLRSIVDEGTIGRIYKGTFLEEGGVEVDVLVKTLKEGLPAYQESFILDDGLSLYGLAHRNILSIFGVSIEDKTPPFLLYLNPVGYTNLKRHLRSRKPISEGAVLTLSIQEVVSIALQIVQALQFLLRRKILHQDIASRNCVIDEKLRVKVTDNALSRDLFPEDYHCLGDNEQKPIKWMSLEAILERKYSELSDVWSFGIVLWELVTSAQQPYIEISPFEMATFLKEGYRLAQPINCPHELFALMAYCWSTIPEERPTFSHLITCLQDFYNQITRYI